MKAPTIRPNWPCFVVSGYKDIETRSWPVHQQGRIRMDDGSGPATKAELNQLLSNRRNPPTQAEAEQLKDLSHTIAVRWQKGPSSMQQH